jgi:hypothetical protein
MQYRRLFFHTDKIGNVVEVWRQTCDSESFQSCLKVCHLRFHDQDSDQRTVSTTTREVLLIHGDVLVFDGGIQE